LIKLKGEAVIPLENTDDGGEITNQNAINTWKQKDVTARNYLYATTDTQHQRGLVNCKSASEMWVRLSTQYLQKAPENKHMLQHQFFDYKFLPEHKVIDERNIRKGAEATVWQTITGHGSHHRHRNDGRTAE
jgi:hypothetical protein